MSIKNIVRENIRNLKPYTSARSLFNGGDALLLDANENGEDLFNGDLNRYPDPLQRELKNKIAKLKNVPAENIFLGNGSDEAIDLLFRIFCEPKKDNIIICPPTYGMYKVQANIHDVEIKEVLLNDDFDLRPEEVLKASNKNSKLLFICSPNNPTGNLMEINKVGYLIENFKGIVVVDEAYIDYVETDSWTTALDQFDNLIVLQTFSKAWALAGVRLGMAFASEEIIHYLNSVKFPYNINCLTQNRMFGFLDDCLKIGEQFYLNIDEKRRVELELIQLKMVEKIYPSDANFLLVKFKNSKAVFNYLKNKKIIIRDRSREPKCDNCLRITIGAKKENNLLLAALKMF